MQLGHSHHQIHNNHHGLIMPSAASPLTWLCIIHPASSSCMVACPAISGAPVSSPCISGAACFLKQPDSEGKHTCAYIVTRPRAPAFLAPSCDPLLCLVLAVAEPPVGQLPHDVPAVLQLQALRGHRAARGRQLQGGHSHTAQWTVVRAECFIGVGDVDRMS